MAEYPNFDLRQYQLLLHIRELAEADPDYFDRPECPYPQLKNLLGAGKKPPVVKQGAESIEVDELNREVLELFEEIKAFGDELSSADVAEKASYFRVRTSLLEKLVTLKEKTHGVKQAKAFMDRVIGILDDVMNTDQRAEVLRRLQE